MQVPTIYQVILRIAGIFAIIEILIMLGFAFIFTNYSPITETLIDVSILTTLATPLVYLTVIKPYITAIHELVASMKQQALTDYLTQLANRRAFEEHLKRLIAYSQRHGIYSAIIYIDLDGFKAINDIYGHAGGDEFIISLPDIANSTEQAIKFSKSISKNILKSLTTPIQYENTVIHVGASIGIRIVTPINDTIEKILAEADSAMYKAKQSLKEKIMVFEPVLSHS